MGEITKYPLAWPDNVARTAPHERRVPRFRDWTTREAVKQLLAEINRLNNRRYDHEDERVIVSSNIPLRQDFLPQSGMEPKDPGCAVYFHLSIGVKNNRLFERPVVLTCDRWARVAWNLYAIFRDIGAQRARMRWGCTNVEQAFRGYVAIPERAGGLSWWEVLGINPAAAAEQIKEAYRQRSMIEHPDKGGSNERFQRLQKAYEQAMDRLTNRSPGDPPDEDCPRPSNE